MNTKVRDTLFILIFVSLLFNVTPLAIQFNFFGGPLANKLTFYPLVAGWVISILWQLKSRDVFVHVKSVILFLLAFVGINLVSTIWGLSHFPYYDEILAGPIDQIKKLPAVLSLLNSIGINPDPNLMTLLWFIARQIKGTLFEAFWFFGGAYLIFCWYRKDVERAIKLCLKGAVICALILLAYAAIELPYLAHNAKAQSILEHINPFIHDIMNDGKWWPPLLWQGQLRNVFAEPSYYGIFLAFLLPFLWFGMFRKQSTPAVKLIITVMAVILTFFIYLTKARTALVLHLGEMAVFIIALWILVPGRLRSLKQTIAILAISFASFFSANYFILYAETPAALKQTPHAETPAALKQYIDSNILSVAKTSERSNPARFSVMKADFAIGLDHPLLGVGKGLRSAYIPDYFDEAAFEVGEIRMWLDFRKKLGIMRSGFPALGEYTSRFAETGLLGLALFMFPVMLLCRRALKTAQETRKIAPVEKNTDSLLLLVSFTASTAGIAASGIGDTLNITWCWWFLLGLGFVLTQKRDQD